MNHYRFQFSLGAAFGNASAMLIAATFEDYKLAIIFTIITVLSLIDCVKESRKVKF